MTKIEKLDLKSMNITEDKVQKLKQLFPEVITEGNKVDFEKLKTTLGESVDTGKERYGMNWPGKADCFKIIQQPSIGTLVPVRKESVNFDTTENLFIEGDNLEVLKLLQKSYLGKIKMISIDPPYNTGNDFIYPDNYTESLDTYLRYTGQLDSEGRRYSTNTETDGRFHSKWLSMMYPRLFLARNLLREDGVIFISIDNIEMANLRKICDEVFGEDNFIECITWNKRVPKNDKGIGSIHEYIIVYVKDSSLKHEFTSTKSGLEEIEDFISKLKINGIPLKEAEQEIRKLYNKKDYDRGITLYNALDENYRLWGKINMSWPNANTFGPKYEVKHPETGKPVKIPDRGWRWKEETFNEAAGIKDGKYSSIKKLHDGSFVCGKIWFDKDETTQASSITYFDEVKRFLLRSILSTKSDGGIEVENIFDGKSYFSYPKPTTIIKAFVDSFENDKNAIILDFFAGSGTTAHAVLDLNKQDGGNRKFIMVQLPEPCVEDSEAFKAGYKTIADIGKERIRRVIHKIKKGIKENRLPLFPDKNPALDLGFKVFKLSSSNFKLWDTNAPKEKEAIQKQLSLHVDHINPTSSQEDILYEILLKSGFPLTTKIELITLAGKTIFSIADGAMLICLEKELTAEVMKAIAEKMPVRVVCLDAGFKGNDQLKTNAVQIMKSRKITDFRTV